MKILLLPLFLVPALAATSSKDSSSSPSKTSATEEPSTTTDAFASLTNPSPLRSIPSIPNNRTISLFNNCAFGIYPASLTTNGTGPYTSGFYLESGETRDIWVASNWTGRIWGRTNCSFAITNSTTREKLTDVIDFNATTLPSGTELTGGCWTGDCGPAIQCELSGLSPATLAEFNMHGWMNLTYFDISLVDGYSLDMKIVPHYDKPDHPRRLNSPVCVASRWLSSTTTEENVYGNSLNESYSFKHIQRFCPRSMLLKQLPYSSFPYPDDHDENERGGWTPCLSSCAYSGSEWDCCTGKHDKSETCGPNLYSRRVKQVCPDAYSYAYDDYYSTFAVPMGEGFDITFCPGGVSSSILKTNLPPPSAGSKLAPALCHILVIFVLLFILDYVR